MNVPPFGGHFSTGLPTIHHFAKLTQDNASSAALCSLQDNSNRYTANGIPSFTQHHPPAQHQLTNKYHGNYVDQSVYIQQNNIRLEKRPNYEQHELNQELCAAMLQQQKQSNEKTKDVQNQHNTSNHQNNQPQNHPTIVTSEVPSAWQSLASTTSTVADYLSQLPTSTLPLSLHHFLKYSAETIKKETTQQMHLSTNNETGLNLLHNNVLNISNLNVPNTVCGNGVFTSASTSANASLNNLVSLSTVNTAQIQSIASVQKKKKKKRNEKEKKPRPKPGEIRLTTALDGSTLYCCPECHMAYPEKELLEQHLVGHTLERRFVCDICGAGLKRKDHLTRHKQSHNPERPFVCTVCLKAFKRKEQLTLHFVIHSGEKRHVCSECGKGFYRKDHLRKHTRSHIARRVKAELSQHGTTGLSSGTQVPTASNCTVVQEIMS